MIKKVNILTKDDYFTKERLYEEIFKPKFIAETDIQNLYKKILNKDKKHESEENYITWRQKAKNDVKIALEKEL